MIWDYYRYILSIINLINLPISGYIIEYILILE